jgi:ParB/RepB/Spo0J family partition protein
MVQLSLISDEHIKKSIIMVSTDSLKISEYNPRKERDKNDITRLAERISRNGYEITRALWAERNGDGYEVFAGGTRLEAARLANLTEIPIVLHEGLTEDDKVRLADEDNENDEYHEKVSPVDVWANYAWLSEQGWTQERIAKAKRVNRSVVSERCKWYNLPETIKTFVYQDIIQEAHLRQISSMSIDRHFSPWLTTEQAQLELCQKAQGLTVRQTKDLVSNYKNLITRVTELCKQTDRPKDFIALLAETKSRSMAQVQEAYNRVKEVELREARRRELALVEQRDKAEAERIRLEQETEKNRVVQEILDNIILGNLVEILPTLDDESIDAIITDPPYPKEYLPLYETLAIQAARLLKPGGSLVVMCGQSYLPEIFKLMTPHLNYFWTFSYQTPGGQSPQIWKAKVNTFWKPILWFVKGDYKGIWHGDVIKSDVNDNDKRHHHWGQSESGMARIVKEFTEVGHVILDPFAGGGTTGLVSIALKRKFIGCDIDKKSINTTKERIYNMLKRG